MKMISSLNVCSLNSRVIKSVALALIVSVTGITTPASAGEVRTTTVTDAAGTVQTYIFEENLGVHRLLSERHQDGQLKTREYDANNNVTARVDELGRRQESVYNSNNQRTRRTEAAGTPQARTTAITYLSNDLDLPTQISRPSVVPGLQAVTAIAYDTRHNPISITQSGFTPTGSPATRSTQISYNTLGQVTGLDGPRTDVRDVTTFTYNTCTAGGGCGQLATSTNALGQTTTYNSYDANGHLLQSTDANGTVTTNTYDARGRLMSQTETSASGTARTNTYAYDMVGQLIRATDPVGLILSYVYDAAHDLRSVTDSLGNKVSYGYDIKGNRTRTNINDPDGTLVRTVQTVYDLRNRVSQINNAGSLTDQVRNAVGQLITETDPNRNPNTTHQYDALDRLTQTLDALGNPTGYTYDDQDNLTQAAAPNGATTTYTYDDLGNQLTEISPDRGTLTYTHDAAGNVLSLTDARGITRSYQYDALNRLTGISYTDSSEDIAYLYDGCSNGAGRLCQVTDQGGTTNYSYDGFGNITTETSTREGVSYTTAYTYDVANRIIGMTYPDGRLVTYQRNVLGQITAMDSQLNGSSQNVVTGRAYRADGLLTTQTLGNGLVETRSYDTQGKLIKQIIGNHETRNYNHDANGNILTITAPTHAPAYNYDALDRLTKETLNTILTDYTYDPSGNRLTKIKATPAKKRRTLYSYATGSNQLIQVGRKPVTFDAGGNTLSDRNGRRRFEYNQTGRLSRFYKKGTLKAEYTYNSQNQRTRKVLYVGSRVKTITYHYDLSGNLIAEYRNGKPQIDYLWADSMPVMRDRIRQKKNGAVIVKNRIYLTTDHLNTPRIGTDEGNTMVWRWDSNAFGKGRVDRDPDGDGIRRDVRLRFPGQIVDRESGLYYNWNRYYDPGTGRYITSDPIGLNGGLNTFGYVGGNPLGIFDQDGLTGIFGHSVLINETRRGTNPNRISRRDAIAISGYTNRVIVTGAVVAISSPLIIVTGEGIIGIGGIAKEGVKVCSKKIAENKDAIRKAACAAGFVAACTQGKLPDLDKIRKDLEMLDRVRRSTQIRQQTTHLPK